MIDGPDIDTQAAQMSLADQRLGRDLVRWMPGVRSDEGGGPGAAEKPVLHRVPAVGREEQADGDVTMGPHSRQGEGVERRDDRVAGQVHLLDERPKGRCRPVAPGAFFLDLNVESNLLAPGLHDLDEGRRVLTPVGRGEPVADVDGLGLLQVQIGDPRVLPARPPEVGVVQDDQLAATAAPHVQLDEMRPEFHGPREGSHRVLGRQRGTPPVGVDVDPRRTRRLAVFPTFARRGTAWSRLGVAHGHGRTGYQLWLVTLLTLTAQGAWADGGGFWDAESRTDLVVGAVDGGRIDGIERLRLLPAAPVSTVSFFLYPEHYRDPPRTDDLLAERVWPDGPSSGGQGLSGVWLLDCASGQTQGEVAWQRREGPARAELLLPGPSAAPICLELRSFTTVPRMFGSFGVVRRRLAANGGLVPMLIDRQGDGTELLDGEPARANRFARVRLPEGWAGTINGALLQVVDPPGMRLGDPRPLQQDGDGWWALGRSRWLSLVAGPGQGVQRIPLDDGAVLVWLGRPLTRTQIRWVRAAAETTREVARRSGLDVPGEGMVLAEAAMRRFFVEDGEEVLFVSDRYLEADLPLWRYHDLHLARAMLFALLRDAAELREGPLDRRLVQEGLAWVLVDRYLRARWKGHRNLRELLSRFAFLPAVDDLLETPAFPFADQIYDDPWVADPLRADVGRWNRPIRSGRTMLLRTEDRVGTETVRAAADAWVRGGAVGPPLRDLLAVRGGLDAGDLFDRWHQPPPSYELSVERVERRRQAGGWRTELTIRRSPGEAPEAPIEVLARSLAPGARDRFDLRWDGKEEQARWVLESDRRIDVIQVDPRGRVLELEADGSSRKANNRSPRALSVTGYGYFVAVNARLATFVAQGVLNLRAAHELRNHLLLRVFASERVRLGGGLTGQRYFGRPRPGRRYEHRISASFDLDWLESRFAPTEAPLLIEGRVSWIWDSRAWSLSPTRGGSASVAAFVGRDLMVSGTDTRPLEQSAYVGFDAEAVRLLPLAPGHVLGLRGRFGLVAGNVTHRLFALGGLDGLRGVPEEWKTGQALLLGAVEWRHTFVDDLDIPLPFLRFRALRGALFVEAGAVAPPGSIAPHVEDARVSLGYGLRFFGDWFGMLPGAVGIDLAWSPDVPGGHWPAPLPPAQWPGVPFQVYLVGSQSF